MHTMSSTPAWKGRVTLGTKTTIPSRSHNHSYQYESTKYDSPSEVFLLTNADFSGCNTYSMHFVHVTSELQAAPLTEIILLCYSTPGRWRTWGPALQPGVVLNFLDSSRLTFLSAFKRRSWQQCNAHVLYTECAVEPCSSKSSNFQPGIFY